ncbi:MAG: FkbM family methyltransferase [Thermosynechococcaceae cyanobacterium]
MGSIGAFLENLIRQNRHLKVIELGAEFASFFLKSYWNEGYFEMNKNGEFHLIRAAQAYFKDQQVTVFDVGANHGQWSVRLKELLPDSVIHCFEIVPNTFDILVEKLAAHKGIVFNNTGLSDVPRELQVTFFTDEDTGSSIQALPWDSPSKSVACDVVSGDQYCKEHGIDKIDFLKVDTEGHEVSILKGFSERLKSEKITLIQFEYGFTYLPPRSTLGDVYDLLSPYGYCIGRLYPKGVEFKPYDFFVDENFKMGNYVAVHKSAPSLIQQLSVSGQKYTA